MATWKNLDTLASYSKLAGLKGHVNIAEAMTGENGAERVKKYSAPMAAGLAYNYAAKQVDETVPERTCRSGRRSPAYRQISGIIQRRCDQYRRETYGSSSPCT